MLNIIKLSIVASICLYLVGQVFAWSGDTDCKGWKCEEVTCWDGYAVYIPKEKAYLPCSLFEKYVNGDRSVLIK